MDLQAYADMYTHADAGRRMEQVALGLRGVKGTLRVMLGMRARGGLEDALKWLASLRTPPEWGVILSRLFRTCVSRPGDDIWYFVVDSFAPWIHCHTCLYLRKFAHDWSLLMNWLVIKIDHSTSRSCGVMCMASNVIVKSSV